MLQKENEHEAILSFIKCVRMYVRTHTHTLIIPHEILDNQKVIALTFFFSAFSFDRNQLE